MDLLRTTVVTPLLSGLPAPTTLAQISEELQRRRPQPDLQGKEGKGRQSSRGPSPVQRIVAGTLLPTRDIVHDLLDIAEQRLPPVQAPSARQQENLWAAYYAALKVKNPDLRALYEAFDTRDTAMRDYTAVQRQVAVIERRLEQARLHNAQAASVLAAARRRLDRTHRVAIAGQDEMRQWRQQTRNLAQQAARMDAEISTLREQVAVRGADAREAREQAEHLEAAKKALEEQSTLLQERLEEAKAAARETQRRATEAEAQAETAHSRARTAESTVQDAERRAEEAEHTAREAEAAGDTASREAADAQTTAQEAQHAAAEARRRAEQTEREAQRDQELAASAIAHLESELSEAHRELRRVRQEAVRLDAELTELVQEKALNAELDDILAQALRQQTRDDAPQDVATTRPIAAPPESNRLPSSQPYPRPRSSISAGGLQPPAGHASTTPSGMPGPSTAKSDGRASPNRAASGARPPLKRWPRGLTVMAERPRRRRRIRVTIVLTALAALGLGGAAAAWWARDPGRTVTDNKKASTAPTPAGSRPPASSLPKQPDRDEVVDIGGQPVNTAAIMKLNPCASSGVSADLTTTRNTYTDASPDLRLRLTAPKSHAPCRIDVSRTATLLIIKNDADKTVWNSGDCATGHTGVRWAKLTSALPATVYFHWNLRPSTPCTASDTVPAGTYLATASVLRNSDQVSFVLADPEPDPSTSVRVTPSGDLIGGNSQQPSPRTSTPSIPNSNGGTGERAGGANGSNGGGDSNGGLFGGAGQ
ncbi:hypothetical protein ACFYXH_40705 [Streptomyces sp. NPDC002730]|uniref:hypothetical protein n=1 Tax=Streptomyces sp. NPDC002730 TaxID=3364662 RepID=UPI0036B56E23